MYLSHRFELLHWCSAMNPELTLFFKTVGKNPCGFHNSSSALFWPDSKNVHYHCYDSNPWQSVLHDQSADGETSCNATMLGGSGKPGGGQARLFTYPISVSAATHTFPSRISTKPPSPIFPRGFLQSRVCYQDPQ